VEQRPAPGSRIIACRGDSLEFSLSVDHGVPQGAWLRTNIGHARTNRNETIEHVATGRPILHRDWHDIPMVCEGPGRFSIKLPLLEVGRFEAKAFCRDAQSPEPKWPAGGNVVVKVEPLEYNAHNTIYTAFVRQFGPAKFSKAPVEEEREAERLLHEAGYTVIPASGTFRDLIAELDHVIDRLGFRIIQLLPIHPTPTTYARMGRHFGSPFAALDFTDVDPALAEFDRHTTPMDQFVELVDAIHDRGAKIFLDVPANHTGWGSHLQIEHPEWFAVGEDKAFRSPSAWGVTWEDLAELNYDHTALWVWMADVFIFWCRRGVDGFRCDAGYMIPAPVWEYVVARVRQLFPDTIFLLEGLGGSLEITHHLLDKSNLDWAYSELFQNYDREQIEAYLPGCNETSTGRGLLVHFAETHDNPRLAARSAPYARLRTAFTALCSHSGAFGITNGVEWLADEKVDVHGASSLNWGNSENLVEHIARINAILQAHPSFRPDTRLRLIHKGTENTVAVLRSGPTDAHALLVLANLDDEGEGTVAWDVSEFPYAGRPLIDLMTGETVTIASEGAVARCLLSPGQVLCLTRDSSDSDAVERALQETGEIRVHNMSSRIRAKVLDIHHALSGLEDISGIDIDNEARAFSKDPLRFCRSASGVDAPNATTYTWPRDSNRTVLLPPGHFLNIVAADRFTVVLCDGHEFVRRESSIPLDSGLHCAIFLPLDEPDTARLLTLELVIFSAGGRPRRERGQLLLLTGGEQPTVRTSFDSRAVRDSGCYALCTNEHGAMAQARGAWGTISSQYDALLAGNLHPLHPVDRRVMLTRVRGWLKYEGYSQSIDIDCLDRFFVTSDGIAVWRFVVPAGHGTKIPIEIRLALAVDRDEATLTIGRGSAKTHETGIDDEDHVTVILRPDVEDRINHETTKAFSGPEHTWPAATLSDALGFRFGPSKDHRLEMTVEPGRFVREPEWAYMVPHPVEVDRGLAGSSDLFSPGYFSINLHGGSSSVVRARISTGLEREDSEPAPAPDSSGSHDIRVGDADEPEDCPIEQALVSAMRQFIVRRGDSTTVIAGYPWFLDWGRDTLIVLRGMIAAGFLEEARDILVQFARFESRGTLPNMIRGDDFSNRDTSDAPLWFVTACTDLLHAEGSDDFLNADCGGRTISAVILSIAEGYRDGTPNGIVMDRDSGLIFSPAHFTWMDTNHPAGSPREGYAIEIQALWHATLTLVAAIDLKGNWASIAARVRDSIHTLYAGNGERHLSDCLHGPPGCPASEATPDDALRPNQLLAITLGAVTENDVCRDVLESCEELLVAGAIRSLSNRPVRHPIPVYFGERLLNDPNRPYWGTYRGDEENRRKPAYHNGTAWTWLFPSYCEALCKVYGESARPTALSLLSSSIALMNDGCIGHLPEIVDGDSPHQQRGCGAQAWGASESHRVYGVVKSLTKGR